MATILLSTMAENAGWNAFWSATAAMVGATIDQSLFGPQYQYSQTGPRLNDLHIQTSTYGAPIPLVYGQAIRISGNIIWGTKFVEHVTTETQSAGGKGGGGSATTTTTTYSYTVSFAVSLCKGPLVGINRVWADGKPINLSQYDYNLYLGDEAQLPDEFIEGIEGAGNVPAYRGMAYIVFKNFPVTDFGNRIPSLSFEVLPAISDLEEIVNAISLETGGFETADIDASDLAGITVPGYTIAGDKTFRNRIEQLQLVYLFDGGEQNGQVVFRRRNIDGIYTGDVLEVPADDIGAYENERPADPYTASIKHELELPRKLTVNYLSKDKDYQNGTMPAMRRLTRSQNEVTVDLSIALTDAEAKALAEARLFETWLNRTEYNTSLPVKYVDAAPGDIIKFPTVTSMRTFLAGKTTFGRPGLLKISGVEVGGTIYRIPARHVDGEISPGLGDPPTAITLEFLDIPKLPWDTTPNSEIVYVAATADIFYGANVYRTDDGGTTFRLVADHIPHSIMGKALTVLATGPVAFFDEAHTVDVQLYNGTLESRPKIDVLNGFNAALLGNEIIQFRSAELIGEQTYRLSGLLRGHLGTDHEIGNHAINERFILLDSKLKTVPVLASDWYALRRFRVGSITLPVSDASYDDITFTPQGNAAKPYSVVHVKGTRNGDGDLAISWVRRTRGDGSWKDFVDVPLVETFERYEIEIMSGTTVKRTLTATTPAATYTAVQQTADFGSAQSTVTVRIYQMSETRGRGQVKEATL